MASQRVYFSKHNDDVEGKLCSRLQALDATNASDVTIQDLSREFKVTPSTIRKFLDKITTHQELPRIKVVRDKYVIAI